MDTVEFKNGVLSTREFKQCAPEGSGNGYEYVPWSKLDRDLGSRVWCILGRHFSLAHMEQCLSIKSMTAVVASELPAMHHTDLVPYVLHFLIDYASWA